jgi:APA family basic amino acid/polyamine antiporter
MNISQQDTPTALLPKLGIFATTSLVVGGMIGSGIFRNPSAMAEFVHSPHLLIAVWVVAGIVTLFGALTNAEVAGLIPITGGQYQYFRAMYGEFVAFLYGWALFVVIQCGSIASITFVFAEYVDTLVPLWHLPENVWQAWAIELPFATIFPLQNIGIKLLTISAVGLLTIINIRGVREGGFVQSLLTSAKVAAMLFLVAFAFISPAGSVHNITAPSATAVPVGSALMLALVMAMNKALWSYDGWNNLTYVSGEVVDPQRTVPRSLILGTVICICVYVMINLAYLVILPIDQLAASTLVARDAANLMLGTIGATFVSWAVIIATIGTSNGTILASSRVYYSMAQEKMFFSSAGRIHERFNTPARSLTYQFLWTSVLVMSGTFDILTDMLIFISWGFYALGAYGVFVLRKKMPHAPRPYRTWGYPIVPILFILFAVAFLVYTVAADITRYQEGMLALEIAREQGASSPASEPLIINSLWGTILMLTGVPFYWYFRRLQHQSK